MNPHAVETSRACAALEGIHPRAPCADVGLSRRDRETAKLLKKILSAPKWHRWGGRGCRLLGAAFSVSQIVQLLLPGLCFAYIYTKSGHSRNAEELCSLSTLRVLFLVSREEFGHPFPSLHPLPIAAHPHPSTKSIHPLSSSFPDPSLWGWVLLTLS